MAGINTIRHKNVNFNKQFGLNWRDHLNKRILIFFGIASVFMVLQILIVVNLDYSGLRQQNQFVILEKYKRLVTELITEYDQSADNLTEPVSDLHVIDNPLPSSVSQADARNDRRRAADSLMARQGVLNPDLNVDAYAHLPDIEEASPDNIADNIRVIELSQKASSSGSRSFSRANINNYEIKKIDEPLKNLYNYVIRRQGNAYINPTEELLKEEAEFGYRDPDEIQRVISKYQPMIEYCYRKALMENTGTPIIVKLSNVSRNISNAGGALKNLARKWVSPG